MHVILVGSDAALLEGLAQSFASQGASPTVVASLFEACEAAVDAAPIMVVVDRAVAVSSPGEALSVPLAPGGSLVLYRGGGEMESHVDTAATPALLQRSVMAELTLPLERNRLMAMAAHVGQRAVTTGRSATRREEAEGGVRERPRL